VKLAVSRVELAKALEKVTTVMPTSKMVPILTYARVEARQGRLFLSGTDLAVSVTIETAEKDCRVVMDGVALFPAADVLAFLRSTSQPLIGLSLAEDGLLVRCGSHTRVYPQPVEDFPDLPTFTDAQRHTLDRTLLLAALRLARPAAATGGFNARLGHVGLRQGTVVASDGIRLHQIDLPDSDLLDLCLPPAFVDDAVRLLHGSSERTVELGLPETGGHVVLRHGEQTLTCTCPREAYPDVSATLLIPAGCATAPGPRRPSPRAGTASPASSRSTTST
jgi:DNA polymerase III sliding clamp (beta) subunit (PCNA family)